MAPLITSDLSPTQKLVLVVGVTVALLLANWEWWSGKEGGAAADTDTVDSTSGRSQGICPFSAPLLPPVYVTTPATTKTGFIFLGRTWASIFISGELRWIWEQRWSIGLD